MHAIQNGARAFAIEYEELRDAVRLDSAVALAVSLVGTDGTHKRCPLNGVYRVAYIHAGRQFHEIFGVEHAQGFVRTLDETAESCKMPDFSVRHAIMRDAGEE